MFHRNYRSICNDREDLHSESLLKTIVDYGYKIEITTWSDITRLELNMEEVVQHLVVSSVFEECSDIVHEFDTNTLKVSRAYDEKYGETSSTLSPVIVESFPLDVRIDMSECDTVSWSKRELPSNKLCLMYWGRFYVSYLESSFESLDEVTRAKDLIVLEIGNDMQEGKYTSYMNNPERSKDKYKVLSMNPVSLDELRGNYDLPSIASKGAPNNDKLNASGDGTSGIPNLMPQNPTMDNVAVTKENVTAVDLNAISPFIDINNAAICPQAGKYEGKEFYVQKIPFIYSLESNAISPSEKMGDMELVLLVEKVIHESAVAMWLDCFKNLQRRTLQTNNDTYVQPSAIVSSPPDEIKSNTFCEDMKAPQNNCVIVGASFSVLYVVDEIDDRVRSSANELKDRSLLFIEQSMEDDSYKASANSKIVAMEKEDMIEELRFLYAGDDLIGGIIPTITQITGNTNEDDESDIWNDKLVIIVLPIICLMVMILLIILLLRCRKRGKKEQIESVYDDEMKVESADTAHVIIGDVDDNNEKSGYEENIEDEILRNGAPQKYESSSSSDGDGSAKSRTSISSYNTNDRHTLDVHQCTSAFCLICQRQKTAGTTQFEKVDLPDFSTCQVIELQPKVKPNWWKNGDYGDDL